MNIYTIYAELAEGVKPKSLQIVLQNTLTPINYTHLELQE